MAHRAALIFVSIALSQTPAYAARPVHQCGLVHRAVCLFVKKCPSDDGCRGSNQTTIAHFWQWPFQSSETLDRLERFVLFDCRVAGMTLTDLVFTAAFVHCMNDTRVFEYDRLICVTWRLRLNSIILLGTVLQVWLQHRATNDHENDCNDIMVKQKIYAHFRAFPSRLPCAQAFQSRSRSKQTHSIPWKASHTALIKIVCVRLLVATAIWRTIIHCYWLLALLTQYVGLKFPYTSIRLSFDNSLDIIIQRWLNTYRYARIY